jgi:hypothetical protein
MDIRSPLVAHQEPAVPCEPRQRTLLSVIRKVSVSSLIGGGSSNTRSSVVSTWYRNSSTCGSFNYTYPMLGCYMPLPYSKKI